MREAGRRLVLGLLIVALTLMVGGSALAASQPPRVALIMKTLTNPFFLSMEEGARNAAAELGVRLEVVAAERETSITQQIALIEDMTTRRVDAIVIAPIDSKAVVPALSQAKRAGIPVVNLDNRIDPIAAQESGLQVDIFISADNDIGGRLAGAYLAALMGGGGKVAMLEGIPGVENAEGRKRGFLTAMSLFPDIRVVASQTANWQTEEALNVFTNILQAHPDLDGLFAANDMMALGAIQAIEAAGKMGKVYVTSYDNLEAAQAAILEGKMHATIEQNPALMGYYGVKFALDLIQGRSVPSEYMVPLQVVDRALLERKR
ncbi:sugar ABC transporter substrate-binding protein [Limnochorda pilosa]|uniref:Monosaccharide-transporting ATPase n=1 Tax=Limnochorda pilosa TaxID=1555112 RepID=A0A0K2SLV0_LIMPI|nr:sugar ABC transporter substrate-binding protein [Limnochorda pilosa]BAS28080.1 monosaccharide-transporting ATPase [Limnochorda pilosa]